MLLLLCRASGEPPRDAGGERGAASPRTPLGAAAEDSAALQAENVAPLCRRPPRWLGRRPSAEGCSSVAADGDGSSPAAVAAVAAPMRRPEAEHPRTEGSNSSRAAPDSEAARPELGTPDAVASYRPMLPHSRRALLGEGGCGWASASSADSAGSLAAGAPRGCRRAARPRCRACSREAALASSGPAAFAPAPRAPASHGPASSACCVIASAAPHLPAPAPLPLAAPVPDALPPAASPVAAPKPTTPPSATSMPTPPLPAPLLHAPPLAAVPLPDAPPAAAPPAATAPAAALSAGADTLRAGLWRVMRPRCRACIIVAAAASSVSAIPCSSSSCSNSSSASASLKRRPSAEGCPPVAADGDSSTSAAPAAPAAPPLTTCRDSSSASASLKPVAAAVATPPLTTAGSGVAGTWLPKALLDGTSFASILVLVRCRTTLPRWMACTFAAASAWLGRWAPKATVGRFDGGETPAVPAVLAPSRCKLSPSAPGLPATRGRSVTSNAPAPISRRAESAETIASPASLGCLRGWGAGLGCRVGVLGWGAGLGGRVGVQGWGAG